MPRIRPWRSRRKNKVETKPVVAVMKLTAAPGARDLSVPGTALAYTQASIYARSSGYVKRRLVDIGDRVHKGQLLAVIDAPDLDQQVAQVRSVLAQSEAALVQMQAQEHLAQLNWERYKVLVAKGVFSRQDGDTQEANLRVAQANVNAAQSTVQANKDNLQRQVVLQQYERVTAPFSGIVTARNIDVGTLISGQGGGGNAIAESMGASGNTAGTSGTVGSAATPTTGGAQGGAMFTVATISPLRILVSVPETYAPYVRLKQTVHLTVCAISRQRFRRRSDAYFGVHRSEYPHAAGRSADAESGWTLDAGQLCGGDICGTGGTKLAPAAKL